MVGAPLFRSAPARGNEQWAFFPKPRRSRPPAIAGVRSDQNWWEAFPRSHTIQRVAQRSPEPASCEVASESGDPCCVGNTVRHHVCTNFEVMQRRAGRPKQCKSSVYIRPTIYQSVPSRSVPSYSCREEFFIGPAAAAASLAPSSVRRFPCRETGGRTRRPWQALALTLFRSARSGRDNKFC